MSLPHTFFAGRARLNAALPPLLIASGNSNIYVLDRPSGTILKTHSFNSAANFPAETADVVQSNVDGSYWHVTMNSSGNIHLLKLDGTYETTYIVTGEFTSSTRGMCGARNGYLLISGKDTGTVKSYTVNANGSLSQVGSIGILTDIQYMHNVPRSDGQTVGFPQRIMGTDNNTDVFAFTVNADGSLTNSTVANFGTQSGLVPLPNGNAMVCLKNGDFFEVDKDNLTSYSRGSISTQGEGVESFSIGGDGNFYMFDRSPSPKGYKVSQSISLLASASMTYRYINYFQYLPEGFMGQTPAIAVADANVSDGIDVIDPNNFGNHSNVLTFGTEEGIRSTTTELPQWAWNDYLFTLSDWSTYS